MGIAKVEEALKAAKPCDGQGLYKAPAGRSCEAMVQMAQVALEAAGSHWPECSHAGLLLRSAVHEATA